VIERTTILQQLAGRVFEELATSGFNILSDPEKVFVLVWSLQGEIDNGGFDQFYFNSSGDRATETVAALTHIGAKRTADLVAEANSLFPDHLPPRDRPMRIAQLNSLPSNVSGRWKTLEMEFYADPDGIAQLLLEYLAAKGLVDFDR
jgi:hypothetical protein